MLIPQAESSDTAQDTGAVGARARTDSAMKHHDAPTEALYTAHDDHFDKAAVQKEDLEDLSLAPHRKRFFCWRLTKKKWLAAVIGLLLAVLLVVLLIVFLAIVPAIFQKYVDKVDLSINYLDIKGLPTDPNSNEIEVELSLRVAYDASAAASMSDAQATLYYQGKSFGKVTLPAQKFDSGNEAFELKVHNKAEILDPAVFRSLSKALVTDEQVFITTKATVKASAKGLTYGGLSLDREFSIKAFHNFDDPKPQVNNITLADCTSTEYKLLINATLDNDSQAGIGGVGALNLSVYHEQNYLGQAVSRDVGIGLPRGPSDMVLEVTIEKSATVTAALLGMITQLLAGTVQFYIRGDHPNATQAPLLDAAFAALNISMPYTDGLSKVTLNPKCDLLSLLGSGR